MGDAPFGLAALSGNIGSDLAFNAFGLGRRRSQSGEEPVVEGGLSRWDNFMTRPVVVGSRTVHLAKSQFQPS